MKSRQAIGRTGRNSASARLRANDVCKATTPAADESAVALSVELKEARLLVIDPVVATWTPSRSPKEIARFQEAARSPNPQPIPVWRQRKKDTVLDVEAFEIYRRLGIDPPFHTLEFPSKELARRFVLGNLLGRQHLTKLGLTYVLGAQYNSERKPGQRTDLTVPQNEGRLTPKDCKARFGCSRATIERAGRLARTIDERALDLGPEARSLLLDPRHHLTVRQVELFVSLPVHAQVEVLVSLNEGTVPEVIKIRRPPHATVERVTTDQAGHREDSGS